ncbi:MAG: hypothetical protein ACI8XZ_003959 [Gammaproteobacteria bacterium]|jgi:hypothetical protein
MIGQITHAHIEGISVPLRTSADAVKIFSAFELLIDVRSLTPPVSTNVSFTVAFPERCVLLPLSA